MSFWKARPSPGGWIGIILSGVVLATIAWLFSLLASGSLNLTLFLLGVLTVASLVVLTILAFWTYGYYSLYYTLDRDALRIRWTGFETVIPIHDVREVIKEPLEHGDVSLPLLHWPGYCIGRGRAGGVDAVYYATTLKDGPLLLLTGQGGYVISPEDPEGFVEALKLRQSLEPVRAIEGGVNAFGLFRLSVWSDHLAQWLWLGALLINICLAAYLCAVYPNLDPVVPVHFDAAGQVDRIAPAIVIFVIPLIGWLVLFLNGLLGLWIHQRQRVATLLLWGGTVVVQGFLWVAALGITFHEMAV